jgi:hypothetical protein
VRGDPLGRPDLVRRSGRAHDLRQRVRDFARRTRDGDRYEIVLLLIVVVVVLTPLETTALRPVISALQVLIFIFAFWTSGAPRRVFRAASAVAIAALAVAAIVQIFDGETPRLGFTGVGIFLCAGAIIVIVIHLAAQSRVTRRTVTGALSVYLLIGLLFSYTYMLIGTVAEHGFFAQSGSHPPTDYLYFSYVTLTTVGYGDLTAGFSFGRVLAVLEALMGQLYLVTIVAVVIANIGRERSGPRGRETQ